MIKQFIKRFKFTLDGNDVTGSVDRATLNKSKHLCYDFKVEFKNGDVDYYPHHRFVVEVLPSKTGD